MICCTINYCKVIDAKHSPFTVSTSKRNLLENNFECKKIKRRRDEREDGREYFMGKILFFVNWQPTFHFRQISKWIHLFKRIVNQ